jgi:hypothetical protein
MPKEQDYAIGMPPCRRQVESRSSGFIGAARRGRLCRGPSHTAVDLWEQRAALTSLQEKRERLGIVGAHSGVRAPADRSCRGLGDAVFRPGHFAQEPR